MNHHPNLDFLFKPACIAVVGASATPGKIGNSILKNILSGGYTGKIFPVNPKPGQILGIDTCTDIAALPRPLDLAVLCVPPEAVLSAMEALAEREVKAVIVITAGFKEIGREGYYLEERLARIAALHRIALLGPNCLGLLDTASRLNATFAAGQPLPGNIAFFSQSGALCVSILDWALGHNVGFSKFISLGNKAVLDESDMLGYISKDSESRVILGYIESIEDGARFMRVARDVTTRRPVVMIKAGTTTAGAKAASSHTGAIAGSDHAYTAALRQSGIIRVPDVASLFVLAQAFSTQPLPRGPNVAIVTNSGGPGILAADACESSGLLLASLSNRTVERLKEFLPPFASLYNPIDIIGDATAERYARSLEAVLQDERVHAVLVLLSPTASVQIEATARSVITLARRSDKPIFCCFMGEKAVAPGKRLLQDAGIPCYDFPEPAIYAIKAMFMYSEQKHRPAPVEVCTMRDLELARKVISTARVQGYTELVEFQAQELLKAYNLPLPATVLARTSEDAVRAAEHIGYPVVLKIASPQISHKSDVDGVRVNLGTADAVRAAFLDITARAQRMRKDAYISGCLVQAMAPKGCKEIIVGFKRDPQFGPLILFGLGGVYVEVLKDVSFRLAPLTLNDAQEMIREIKAYPLLRGVRGERAVYFKGIESVLLIMSQLALDFQEIAEAEFNPVLVNEHGALVADVRVILAPED